MSSGSANQAPGAQGGGEGARREEATAFVTGYVERYADVTGKWLNDSAKAFTDCVKNAQKPDYTSNQLVRDVAGMWARNVRYLGELVQIAVPPSSSPGPTTPTEPTTPTDPSPPGPATPTDPADPPGGPDPEGGRS